MDPASLETEKGEILHQYINNSSLFIITTRGISPEKCSQKKVFFPMFYFKLNPKKC